MILHDYQLRSCMITIFVIITASSQHGSFFGVVLHCLPEFLQVWLIFRHYEPWNAVCQLREGQVKMAALNDFITSVFICVRFFKKLRPKFVLVRRLSKDELVIHLREIIINDDKWFFSVIVELYAESTTFLTFFLSTQENELVSSEVVAHARQRWDIVAVTTWSLLDVICFDSIHKIL